MSRPVAALALIALLVSLSPAADWPQWRGPTRSGAAEGGPALLGAWPEEGPPKLWQSEPIPGGGPAGYASPIVADGRVLVYVSWPFSAPFPTRTLSENALKKLGWRPEGLPARLVEAVETARTGRERADLGRAERNAWIDAWIKKHLTPEERETYAKAVEDRLKRGAGAVAWAKLVKLAEIKDHTFDTRDALDAWLDEASITGKLREDVTKLVPTAEEKANDVVLALDAKDGRTLWKAAFPGRRSANGTSATPCAGEGRVFAFGSDGTLYALDASDGALLWKAAIGTGSNASPVLVDDRLIVAAGRLLALSVSDGSVLWEQKDAGSGHASPAVWRVDTRAVLLSLRDKKLVAVDAASGEVLWAEPAGKGHASPVVAGDVALVQTNEKEQGLIGYRLSLGGAERAFTVDHAVRASGPVIQNEHAYVAADKRAFCVALGSGQVLWETGLPAERYASPLLADGKLIVHGGKRVLLVQADPKAEPAVLGQADVEPLTCASFALSGGRLYIRLKDGVACYNLRAAP